MTDDEIRDAFGEFESISVQHEKNIGLSRDDALREIYRRVRPGSRHRLRLGVHS